MSSLLLRPDFLCIKRSLNSVTVKPFIHLKTNSVSRTLYIVSRLSHPVRVIHLRRLCPMAIRKQFSQPLHGVSPGCLNASCCTIPTLSNRMCLMAVPPLCRSLLLAFEGKTACAGVNLAWTRRTSLHLQHDLTKITCYRLALRGVFPRLSTLHCCCQDEVLG